MLLEDNIEWLFNQTQHLDKILGKWLLIILIVIFLNGKIGFYQIKKRVKNISSKVLSTKLKILENLGLIYKEIIIEEPLRVQYFITKQGKSFVNSLSKIFEINIPKKGLFK